jgi:3-dehydroquinate synthase
MNPKKIRFSQGRVEYYFNGSLKKLSQLTDKKSTIILTDEHVFAAHQDKLKGWNVITLKPGEAYKIQATVDSVVETLIEMQADRQTTLVGIGGGVITDLTGYIASIYMRGIRFGFVPTSLLAMVDAAIGGKNGIDVGAYKNMVGVIRQPAFLLFDPSLLLTLPDTHWSDGFAEIIKHACIKDRSAFRTLESMDLKTVQQDKRMLSWLIERNALLKTKVVVQDEFESGERKLLNFGHTLGHAIETQYELSHGQSISLGMVYASRLSEKFLGFNGTDRVINLLQQYGLPTDASFKMEKVVSILRMDKKRVNRQMNYILLEKVGKGIIYPIELKTLEQELQALG